MNKDKTVEYWLTEAKEDWRVARSLFEKETNFLAKLVAAGRYPP